MKLKLLALCFILLITTHSQLLTQVDFVLGASYTGSTLWQNFIGVSIDYTNIQNLMNNTLYQGYMLNSNIKGSWSNNFGVSLKTPLGHKYNCSALAANVTTPNITCSLQTQGNATYWDILGNFVWNTMNAPNWCIGYDMQGVNLTLTSHQDAFYNWVFQVYKSTYYYLFCTQIVDYGDKMVQRGYKTSYSPADFVNDIDRANYVIYSIAHSGPGITEDAQKTWLTALQDFNKVAYFGHYTVRCIVFKDPTSMTLQKILSDNATKYYLRQRFTVNQSYTYSDFSSLWLGINDIRLTTGQGVDGLTNTFASALWALDMVMEFCLLNGWQIDFNHQVRATNFQSILGPAPDLKPTPMYYGLLFAILVKDGSPQIILPSSKAFISSKIKAYGFTTGQIFKLLLINKDTNTSLNGTVLIKSQLTSKMKCIYLEAPSLTAKEGVTIAGYSFNGGNSTVQGSFVQKIVNYSYAAQGYQIPIKYAQAVLCQTEDSIYAWPKGTPSQSQSSQLNIFSSLSLIGIIILMILNF